MERSDLDVWLRQPTRARDKDMRAKENDRLGRAGEGGGCWGVGVIRLLRGQRWQKWREGERRKTGGSCWLVR